MEAVYVDQHFDLVQACKKGDRKAQYQLYSLYNKAMFNTALRVLNNADEAADVLQEAFVYAFAKMTDFRQETTFGIWMKQIVINRSISELRKRKMELISIDDVPLEHMIDEESLDEEALQWEVERIRKEIDLLPDGYRLVLSLYLLEGYDHEEISQILSIGESTSRTQYMRAKKKLVENLKRN